MIEIDGLKFYTKKEKIQQLEKRIDDLIESINLANGIPYIKSDEEVEAIKNYYLFIAKGLKEELNKLKEN